MKRLNRTIAVAMLTVACAVPCATAAPVWAEEEAWGTEAQEAEVDVVEDESDGTDDDTPAPGAEYDAATGKYANSFRFKDGAPVANGGDEDGISLSEFRRVERALPDAVLCRCSGLQNTADVRTAYLAFHESLADAVDIYPTRRLYTSGDIRFSKSCRQVIQEGKAALDACLGAIAPVQKDSEALDLAETLSVFLLDGEMSVTLTAELLHFHKNTVKYRLRRISDLLGYRADKMPELLTLYKACAVKRLMLSPDHL